MSRSSEDNVLTRALDWIKARIVRDNELSMLSTRDMQYLAADIGISETDFRALAPKLADHSDLMDQMMRSRGLDSDAVRTAFGGLVRDMELTCALCQSPALCRRRLADGTAGERSDEFCPNASTMETLSSVR